MTKFQPLYEKGIKFITELLKHFFNVDSDNLYDILNNQNSDEEKESNYSVDNDPSKNHNSKDKDAQSQENKFKDCLTFDDVENQSFLKLMELDCFRPSHHEETAAATDETNLNTDSEMDGTPEEKVETEQFIPYFTKDYNVMFGSPNYIVFIRCFYTMYERLRLAFKIINDKVNEDYKENKDEVLHFYRNYIKAKEHKKKGQNKDDGEMADQQNQQPEENEENIKRSVAKHRMAILIGLSITRFRSKLDGSIFEDLVRVLLGIKAFFFFTFDKLIHTTNKAFQTLINDEYVKSNSFKLFKKYVSIKTHQREKLYLADYKSKLNEMSSSNGYTIRLLYSPKSKILTVHFFTISRPYTNSSLLHELDEYRESFTLTNSNERMYSGELPLPSSKVFLKRNKKAVLKAKEFDVALDQDLPNYFSSSFLKLRYTANKTDSIHRVRKQPKRE